jgi:hypothetical protein
MLKSKDFTLFCGIISDDQVEVIRKEIVEVERLMKEENKDKRRSQEDRLREEAKLSARVEQEKIQQEEEEIKKKDRIGYKKNIS